ncbi:MAG: hypothetical protein JRI23_35755 [Deltaproteobacteria bacterium]|jgi:hypothetical protein|nr:hypothetical protein [Deltaproteobacteria bacterium]MBW2537687.1 hypothetical protein [Deltaproteobacteria bacterium]
MTAGARVALAVLIASSWGCGGSNGEDAETPGVQAVRAADGTIIDDRALCEWKGHHDREVSETAGPGAIQPNVRRVWQVFGTGSDKREVLICREIDTNLDGVKDVVRTYDEEGQSKEERADTNKDGNIDSWILFGSGRVAEIRIDRNYDGEPDEWKNFAEGKLIRVKRDTNYDQKPDVWEIYQKGRLVRMGVDLDHDTRIDRWDHDTEWRRERDRREREAEEAAEKKKRRESGDEPESDQDEDGAYGDDEQTAGGEAAPTRAPSADSAYGDD